MRPVARLLAPLPPLVALSACSLFFVPDEDDDGVQRCDNINDCRPFSDRRLVPACIRGEGQDSASQKVCVADFKPDLNCNPAQAAEDTPLRQTFMQAQTSAGYLPCSEATGALLCPPMAGVGCQAGLELGPEGRCIDPALTGPRKPILPTGELRGQDVKDQYCRYYFCSEDFVCGAQNNCVPCDPNRPFGQGGCGTLYVGSAPSSVYDAPVACKGPDPITHDPDAFGPVPQ